MKIVIKKHVEETCSAAFCLSLESRHGFWVAYDARFDASSVKVSRTLLRIATVFSKNANLCAEQQKMTFFGEKKSLYKSAY